MSSTKGEDRKDRPTHTLGEEFWRSGADPIPQILPRVGLGVPGNGTKYSKNALDWMKACGINVVCNAFNAVKRQPGGLQYVIDITDITESAGKCTEAGIRLIPGVNSSTGIPLLESLSDVQDTSDSAEEAQRSSLTDSAVVAMVDALKDEQACACWYHSKSPKVGILDQAVESCELILEKDQWFRPVLMPLLPASSSISALGGSEAGGWTEANKYSKYCMALHNASLPPIWWIRDSLFNVDLSDDELKPEFFTAFKAINDIKDSREWYDAKDSCVWSSVNCSAKIPSDQSGVAVTNSGE